MSMPLSSEGLPNDFFWKEKKWTKKTALDDCKDKFGHIGYDHTLFRPEWVLKNYGANFAAASNIIFRWKNIFSLFSVCFFVAFFVCR